MEKVHFDPASEATVKMVDQALAWLGSQEASTNYIHDLKVACSLDYAGTEHYRLLASLFPSYDNGIERQAEKEARKKAEMNSDFIGNVGDRVRDIAVQAVICIASWESDYGTQFLYKILDMQNNIFIWKTGNSLDPEHVRSITGTVKEHKEFNGSRETVLTRCKVA